MQLALRPYVTAGVALAGASMIAVTPVIPALPDIHVPAIHVSSDAVDLVSVTDPITAWLDVFGTAGQNISTIAGEVLANPFPILQGVINNQLGYLDTASTAIQTVGQGLIDYYTNSLPGFLQAAFSEIMSGEFDAGMSGLTQALILYPATRLFGLLDLMDMWVDMSQNFANIIATFASQSVVVLHLGLPAMATVMAPFYALGVGGQAVVDAMDAGDPLGALTAFINIPAVVTGGFLNGVPDHFTTGLLSTDGGFGGLLENLLVTVPQALAESIGWTPGSTASLAALPDIGTLLGDFNPASLLGGFDLSGLLDGFDLSALLGAFDPTSMLGDLGAAFDPSVLLAMFGL